MFRIISFDNLYSSLAISKALYFAFMLCQALLVGLFEYCEQDVHIKMKVLKIERNFTFN
jgi:hypothetical protein